MAIISEKLVNFRVYEDGNDLLGVADVELSTLTAMTESIKGAGIAGKFDAPGLRRILAAWKQLSIGAHSISTTLA